MKMEWKKLFSEKREREPKSKVYNYRNCFDMDYQRIIPSSSLRRLQDKTQVFPLQENDFTRTRLTHSLEVSSIGRSIGAQVVQLLIDRDKLSNEDKHIITSLPSLLAVCGLVHDLGNPPFGHYGEDVIKEWFRDNKSKLHLEKKVVDDFGNFDGNAQTIRILSKLQYMKDAFGMNCCYGTLATLIKYPNSTTKLSNFKSEQKLFDEIVENTGMKQGGKICRHPATYLLEAADDIAYLFADLEDAVKKDSSCLDDIISTIESKKSEIFTTKDLQYETFIESINNFDLQIHSEMPEEDIISTKIMSIRVAFQSYCINQICSEFVNSYEKIMSGDYKKALCDSKTLKSLIGEKGVIRDLCIKYAYNNREVLKLEIIGKRVLTTLLDLFVKAVLCEDYEKQKEECGKFYNLISSNFKFIQHIDKDNKYIKHLDKYSRIQLVVDYISGMTDSYALNLHKTLMGVRLP